MESEFELADIIRPGDRSAFEPKVPELIGPESFAFVRTTGVRNAPEILVLELFREIFFEEFSPELKEKQLSPLDPGLSRGEKAVLYVARGRLKLTKHGGAEGFYAPVFPEQARLAWLRKKSDRALGQHLLHGALAQSLSHAQAGERSGVAENIVDALRGRRRAPSATDVRGKEILSAAVVDADVRSTMRSREDAVRNLIDVLAYVERSGSAVSLGRNDALATRIRSDFVALCELEGDLPRLLWLDLLKCFLRLAVPAWVLAQMRITVLLRDWVLAALDKHVAATEVDIKAAISDRWQGLFHPTVTGTNELAMHVERYMKARVELNLLLYLLRNRGNENLFSLRLSISSQSSKMLTVEQLLDLFVRMPRRGADDPAAADQLRRSLLRGAETFAAWANPLRKGQGKNIDEFLRVLRRFEPPSGDTGYLAARALTGHAVFPGPTMIRLLLLLAARGKSKAHQAIRGKFVLADLERHFYEYGLDFSASAGARPKLISELARLGLLKGSPDAGDYTEILVPIDTPRSQRAPARAADGVVA